MPGLIGEIRRKPYFWLPIHHQASYHRQLFNLFVVLKNEMKSLARIGTAKVLLCMLLSSILLVATLLWAAMAMRSDSRSQQPQQSINLYCAASATTPVSIAAKLFNSIHGTHISVMRIGGSGELAGQISAEIKSEMRGGADIFISADDLLITNEMVSDQFTLARQRPVIAVGAHNTLDVVSLKDLVERNEIKFGIASERAAIGQISRKIAQAEGVYEQLEVMKALDAENVMTLAQALVTGSLDAAVIWDSTVEQINRTAASRLLKTNAVLAGGHTSDGHIIAGVLVSSHNIETCKMFCKFMKTAPECRESFLQSGFQLVD